ncbi:peptidylprolyl isomerase [Oceaniglobus roseus]|uniref:peptidylprolyl isomerase n=1 Tax=Oceaniglobus roseus TaxID=1737570 RepID=UPI000C7EC0EE|nr:SurA N-terminal domain-containing protein [Kandeliimicrobium roseum]
MTDLTARRSPARRLPGALLLIALLLSALAAVAPSAQAQSPFTPVAKVNDRVITAYELDQRAQMLQLFRAPGDPRESALTALIEERLQLQEAKRLGITVTPAEVVAGQEEFAGRANLSREEFIKALASAGVSEESFRDFVATGVTWRKVVQERFVGKIPVSETEVDRQIRRGPATSNIRVLLSEVILPANTPAAQAQAEARAREISRITTLPAFADAARRYSASQSRGAGGRIDWIPLANLPPEVAQQVLSLKVGQVTQPIALPNAIALFQLRALEETSVSAPTDTEIDYAAFFIPGGRSPEALAEAARIEARVDTCDDLYGVAKGLPESQLERATRPAAQVPGDLAMELAKLDPGEVSTALTRAGGQTLIFLMLCDRRPAGAEDANRDAIRQGIVGERLTASANALLAELKANATIVRYE